MTSRKLAESQPGHARPGADPSTGVFRDILDICHPGYNTTCVAVLLALNDLTQWPYTEDDPNYSLFAVCELSNVYSKWEIDTMIYTCNLNDKAKRKDNIFYYLENNRRKITVSFITYTNRE